jgi:tRNA (guanine37-N1)-methyltransferase
MVMKPEPVFDAVEAIENWQNAEIVLMTPQGRPFSQQIAKELSAKKHLVMVCGHYEGFDERIREHLATDEISIGDYVLTGGELAALVVIDSVSRLLPGVLGNEKSLGDESFENDLLEYPQYTRPAVYREWPTPDVLLSGHHAKIAAWQLAQQEERTRERRPDLWARYNAIKMQKEAEDALLKRKSRRRRSPEAEIGENNRDLSASGIEDAVMIDRKDMTEETS